MKTINYMAKVTEIIDVLPYEKPIRTEEIVVGLIEASGIDRIKAKRMVNVYLKRLADEGVLKRMKKGVYAKAKRTVFGAIVPNTATIAADLFLREGDEVIGYDAGPTLLNKIGLSTLMPKRQTIATNRFRLLVPAGSDIELKKPIALVTRDNVNYLRIIEAVKAMRRYPVDADAPKNVLREAIIRLRLDWKELLHYAHTFLDNEDLRMVVGIMVEGS
jgi:hypothetical protein